MTHVITSLCVRDNGCADVCPVECIQAGTPVEQWPTYYIDPATCIDCGACVPECPFAAIFHEDDVPEAYQADGGEFLNQVGFNGHYEAIGHHGQQIVLDTTRTLNAGEVVDLRDGIALNERFYRQSRN
jgi:ferredoxin